MSWERSIIFSSYTWIHPWYLTVYNMGKDSFLVMTQFKILSKWAISWEMILERKERRDRKHSWYCYLWKKYRTYLWLLISNRIWVMKGSTEQTTCKCKRGICGVINIYYNKNCATCSEIILEFTYMTCFCRRKLFSYIEYINHQLLP